MQEHIFETTTAHSVLEYENNSYSFLGWSLLVLNLLTCPLRLLWHVVMLGTPWLTVFASRLHRHDVLCYGVTVKTAFDAETPFEDPVGVLTDLEVAMTARLRQADGWVRMTVILLVGIAFTFLTQCASIFLAPDMAPPVVGMSVTVLIALLAVVVFTLQPMAAVAEAFEHEVLRELNTPRVLHGAFPLLGNQLLPHIQLLDWGLRFGDRVINKQGVLALSSGLALTLAASFASTLVKSI